MKDSNEKDEIRFNKLYQLLGDEINAVYEDNQDAVFPKEDTTTDEETLFNDVFNIFNKENPTPNTEAFINTVKHQENMHNKYIEELNNLIDEYNAGEIEETTPEEPSPVEAEIPEEIASVEKPILEDLEPVEEPAPEESESTPDEIITEELAEEEISKAIVSDEELIPEALLDEEIGEDEEPETIEEVTPTTEEIYIEPAKIEISSINKEKENKNDNKYQIDHKNEIRNKTLIGGKDIYDDGLDEVCAKTTLMDILTNRKTIYVLLIVIFIVMFILVLKAFRFGKLVDIYNEYTTETSKTGDNDTKIYDDDEADMETLKKAAAGELIDCINAKVDTNKLPTEVNNVIKEINDYYHSSGKYFAFAYKDLFTGFTVTYNETGNVFAASTIKAPVNIYLYEMASQNKIDLDEKLTYTSKYYNDGTGVLKNMPTNTTYSIRTLSEYAIRNSDNAAHNMLMDKYGKNNIKKFWQEKGTNIIFTGSDNWGLINAHDAMIYMKELYTFYINNGEYGNELMNNFVNAKTKFITGKNEYKVANKSGWSGNAQHDVSIIFAENPYVVVALSNLGYDNNYMTHFNKVNDLAYKLHNEYWKYKMSMCSNIKQYN